MEIAFDWKAGLQGDPESDRASSCGPPEWAALRARLLAGHDASCELSRGSSRRSRGSFASDVARQLAAFEEETIDVNLTDSVNCKWQNAKVAPVAGDIGTGGRGYT